MSKSILQDYSEESCYLCALLDRDPLRKTGLTEHHVFGAANRKKSEHYGLKVRLCFSHHGSKGDKDVHRPDLNEYGLLLKAIGQKAFEIRYGHKRFMEEFGKDYIAGYFYDNGQYGDSSQLQDGQKQDKADCDTCGFELL